MKLTYLFAVATLVSLPVATQALTVGTTSGGNCYPFGCNDPDAPGDRYQEGFSASAFSGPITISSISFHLNQSFNTPPDLKAGTFNLSLSTFAGALNTLDSTNFDANLGPDNALVFSGTLIPQYSGGYLSFNVTPFTYDPSLGNLLLDVSVSGTANLAYLSFFDADYSGSGIVWRVSNYEDPHTNTPLGALVATFNGTVPEPATWALMIAGFGLTGAAMRRRTVVAA